MKSAARGHSSFSVAGAIMAPMLIPRLWVEKDHHHLILGIRVTL